jgi:glycosyltransferase involved in cell wall biosynthesis
MTPLISVLMATFNGEAFVEEAIESVLLQRGVELELVVIDDGSVDATPEIVRDLARRDPRIRCGVRPHAGMAAARNACLAQASGSHIALLDQDDRCPDGKLARQLALLEASPDVAAVFGLTQMFGTGEHREPGYTMLLAAALLRRDVVDAVGEFDPSCASADDLDFLLRMLESGHRIELETGLGTYHRRHPDQASGDLIATRRDCVRALARSLKRRRLSGIQGPLDHPLVAGAGRGL